MNKFKPLMGVFWWLLLFSELLVYLSLELVVIYYIYKYLGLFG